MLRIINGIINKRPRIIGFTMRNVDWSIDHACSKFEFMHPSQLLLQRDCIQSMTNYACTFYIRENWRFFSNYFLKTICTMHFYLFKWQIEHLLWNSSVVGILRRNRDKKYIFLSTIAFLLSRVNIEIISLRISCLKNLISNLFLKIKKKKIEKFF